jgi:hypothetical protein
VSSKEPFHTVVVYLHKKTKTKLVTGARQSKDKPAEQNQIQELHLPQNSNLSPSCRMTKLLFKTITMP